MRTNGRPSALVSLSWLASLAGCSLIFDMGDYERRASSSAAPSSSSSGGSSGRLEDGAIDGGTSSGADASDDRATVECTTESEPNNGAPQANPLGTGETCGVLSDVIDSDFFEFSTATSVQLKIMIPNTARVELFKNGSVSPEQSFTGGGATTSMPAGAYVVRVTHVGEPGTFAAYKLAR